MLARRMKMELLQRKNLVAQMQCLHTFRRGCLNRVAIMFDGIKQRLIMEFRAIVGSCFHRGQIHR